MLLLLLFILQAPVSGYSFSQVITWCFAAGAVLWNVFVYYKNNDKSKDKELSDKLKHFEQEIAKHTLMHQASQQERERLVDNANQRFQTLESRVSQVDQVLTKVTLLEAKLETQNNQIEKLEKVIEKLDNKFDKILDSIRK